MTASYNEMNVNVSTPPLVSNTTDTMFNTTAALDKMPFNEIRGNVRAATVVMSSFYILFGCLGMVGNGLVIVVMVKYCDLKKKLTNVLVVHQSAIDMLAALLLLLSAFTVNNYRLSGGLGQLLCKVWLTLFPLWATFTTSTYNLVCLTLERYCAIVHPIWHRNHFTHARVYVVMLAIWCLGPLINLHQPILTVLEGDACYNMGYSQRVEVTRGVGIFTILIKFCIPLTIMVFCYTRIFLALKYRVEPYSDVGTVTGAVVSLHKKRLAKATRNVIKTLIIVATCFCVCWSFNQIYFFYFCLGNPISFSGAFYHFSMVMIYANCCINPFIYAFKFTEFQQALRRLFHIVHDENKESVLTATHDTLQVE